jgi:hypothetical protein
MGDNIKVGINEIECALNSTGSEYGPVALSCEHGNELSGFANRTGNFSAQLNDYQRLKRTLIPGVNTF